MAASSKKHGGQMFQIPKNLQNSLSSFPSGSRKTLIPLYQILIRSMLHYRYNQNDRDEEENNSKY